MNNKFPGKDISKEDLVTKIPLVAKSSNKLKSKFEISGVEFGGERIPVFAGPNMVESREMIMEVAKNVKQSGVNTDTFGSVIERTP